MRSPRTLAAFTAEEYRTAHGLLAARVASMMGRKLEEGDWAAVYCAAKGIPNAGWSNLNIDVIFQGLGVEHKMLRQPSGRHLRDVCGTRLMHPSATRSIRVPSFDRDPDDAMVDVLTQYAAFLEERRRLVSARAGGVPADMRTGWLLWQADLKEFLYFEEETLPPDPSDYFAEWRESGGGVRKPSKNLWVYEQETGQKRYSITTAAGAKIQPYFDVPPPNDPHVYLFRVQGEEVERGFVRIWVTAATARELRRLLGEPNVEALSLAIETAAGEAREGADAVAVEREEAIPLVITAESYELLNAAFQGVSDEHMMQLLVEHLRRSH